MKRISLIDAAKLCTILLFMLGLCASFNTQANDDNFVSLIKKDQNKSEEELMEEDRFTINFNNVSVIEYIRFVSKITGINFIFDERNLPFAITIVSEEPISKQNILSTLIQVLRVHEMQLLEQDGNLLILPQDDVNQLAKVVSSDLDNEEGKQPPIITRVFRVKNASVNSIATIIRPMVSASALIEVSTETQQLIVSDITTNVDKIALLLESLDSPHTPLEIDIYTVRFMPIDELVSLATQILSPFSEGTPFLLIPQEQTNSIFIVGTPNLIEKSILLLQDLDLPARSRELDYSLLKEDIFFYKIQSQSPDCVLDALKDAVDELEEIDPKPKELIATLKNHKYVPESRTLIFIGNQIIEARVREILGEIDSLCTMPDLGNLSFYVYKIQNTNEEQIRDSLDQLIKSIQEAKIPDQGLISAIKSMQYLPESHSLIFTGYVEALNRLANILPTLDTLSPYARKGIPGIADQFFIYHPQYLTGEAILSALSEIADDFQSQGLRDAGLLQSIQTARWVESTNSLVFSGDERTIDRIKILLSEIDVPSADARYVTEAGAYTFYIYELKNAQGDQVLARLKELAKSLDPSYPPNKLIADVINDIQYIPQNNSLVITGPQNAVNVIKELIEQIDEGSPSQADLEQLLQQTDRSQFNIQRVGNISFMIYRPEHVTPTALMTYLKNVAKDLKRSKLEDKTIVDVIQGMRLVKETKSILFTGPEDVLNEIGMIIQQYDLPSEQVERELAPTRRIPSSLNIPSTFKLYNPEYSDGPELIQIMHDFMQNLIDSGVEDRDMFDTIDTLKWIPKTSTILLSGSEPSIEKVEDLLIKFDVPGPEPILEILDNTTFLVYKLQYHQGSEIQSALNQLGENLIAGTPEGEPIPNEDLVSSINSLQWIQVTNSLISTGEPDALKKLRLLISSLDIPLRQVFIEVLIVETTISNSQQFGLEWAGKAKFRNKVATSFGNTLPPPSPLQETLRPINATNFPNPANIPSPGGLDFGVIGDIILHKGKSFLSLGSLVNALQTDSDSSVIMNPKIITQDNKNSTIFVGSNVPFVGSVVENFAANTQTTTSIEYRNVGVNLSITPILGEEDIITLDITNEISSLAAGVPAVFTGQVDGLLTDQANMNTRVHVPDKHFLVLSGIVQDSKERSKTGIPCLGGLPVVGAAFSSTNRNVNVKNILIFVRPHIINNWGDYVQVTEADEELHKDVADLPILREEFDEATDMIRNLP